MFFFQALKMKHNHVLNKKNKAQETPLLLAAQCSKLDNIKHLIQLGANVNHEDEIVDQSNQSYWDKVEKLVQAKDISSKVLSILFHVYSYYFDYCYCLPQRYHLVFHSAISF